MSRISQFGLHSRKEVVVNLINHKQANYVSYLRVGYYLILHHILCVLGSGPKARWKVILLWLSRTNSISVTHSLCTNYYCKRKKGENAISRLQWFHNFVIKMIDLMDVKLLGGEVKSLESVPSLVISNVWSVRVIPTYAVYRLYDRQCTKHTVNNMPRSIIPQSYR